MPSGVHYQILGGLGESCTINIWNNLQPVITNSTTIPQLGQALQSTPSSGRRGAKRSAEAALTPHAY